MTHLFDLRSMLFAKHAQHIVLVHFPIALFLISVAFDLLATVRKEPVLRAVAYYNLLAAAITSIGAVMTGLTAWQLLYDGGKPTGVLLLHLICAVGTSGLIWFLAIWRYRNRPAREFPLSIVYIVVTFLAVISIIMTAHLGGVLSGVVPLAE
jgi:uncharacterized membrane protein